LEYGEKINKKDYIIFTACKERHEDIVKYLMEYGTNIDIEDSLDIMGLYQASQNGHFPIVKCPFWHWLNKEQI